MAQLDPRRAFLDEIVAHPEDDAARLVYADYLEDCGDPRGEFIRRQVALAHLDQLHPDYLEHANRCRELLFDHREAWTGELEQEVRKAEFHRGFADTITVRGRVFVTEGESLFRDAPIHWLRFNYLKGAGRALAQCPALANVRFLDIAGLKIPRDDLVALLTSPHLCNLRALKLGSWESRLSADLGRALAAMPSAEKLQQLDIYCDAEFFTEFGPRVELPRLRDVTLRVEYGIDGFSQLKPSRLESLSIHGQLRDQDFDTLAQLPLGGLKKVHFESCRVRGKSFFALAASGMLDLVEDFRYFAAAIDREACDALFSANHLAPCRRLEIASEYGLPVNSSRSVVAAVCRHDVMPSLDQLLISHLPLAHLAQLVRSPTMARLRHLSLRHSKLGKKDMDALATSPLPKSLRHLALGRCTMTDDGKQLASMEFPNLIRLDLGHSFSPTLTENGVLGLIRSNAFPKLQSLNLYSMNLSPQVLAAIVKESNMPELREIDFRGNDITGKLIDALFHCDRVPKLSRFLHSDDELGDAFQNKYRGRIVYDY